MATHYQVTICDPKGYQLTEPKSFLNCNIAMRVNEVGILNIPLPADFVPAGIDDDHQVLVERQVENGKLYFEGETAWFAQIGDEERTDAGHVITLMAQDAKCLLNRRIVAYASEAANASSTAVPADNAIKAIVRSNMGSTATDTARSWATTNPALTVQADTSQGATTTKAYAWRNPIMGPIRELADDSTQAGTYLAFDVVKTQAGFEFRTYPGQRGTNRTLTSGIIPCVFSPGQGNLANCKMRWDYTDHVNYVYVGGQGTESDRVIVQVQDAAAIAKFPFGRREGFRDARNTDVTASLTSEGNAYLRAHRPRRLFTAKVVQTTALKYGRDYFLGDIITVDYYKTVFDCRIEAVSINLTNGVETIDINLQTILNS